MVSLERRRSIRIDEELLINYDKESPGKTKNICEHGCCIEINKSYQKGTFLKILFSLPAIDEIMAIGNVMWSRRNKAVNYEIGIQFWHIEEGDRNRIGKYVADQLKMVKKYYI